MNIKEELLNSIDNNNYNEFNKNINLNHEKLTFNDKSEIIISAVKKNRIEIVKSFLKIEKNINFYDKNKRSPLMYSCLKNNNLVFDLLTDRDFDINHVDHLINNVLHYGVKFFGMKGYKSNFYKVEKLIKLGVDLNAKNFFNQTPLIFACVYNNEDMVEFLCAQGANPNIHNGWGDFSPLMISARLNLPDLTELLIKKGADINVGNRIFNYNAYDIANIFNFDKVKSILSK